MFSLNCAMFACLSATNTSKTLNLANRGHQEIKERNKKKMQIAHICVYGQLCKPSTKAIMTCANGWEMLRNT